MNREVHVRIWERPEVRVLRATRHFQPFNRRRVHGPISNVGKIRGARGGDARFAAGFVR